MLMRDLFATADEIFRLFTQNKSIISYFNKARLPILDSTLCRLDTTFWLYKISHLVPSMQEILRRDDVVRTSWTGPNDVLLRRRDDVEPWTPDDVLGTSDDDVRLLRLYDVLGTSEDDVWLKKTSVRRLWDMRPIKCLACASKSPIHALPFHKIISFRVLFSDRIITFILYIATSCFCFCWSMRYFVLVSSRSSVVKKCLPGWISVLIRPVGHAGSL